MKKINMLIVLILTCSSFVASELIVTIQCPKSLDIEHSLNCSISVKNVGNQTVRDIKTRYYLPAGFVYRGRKTGKFSLKWSTPELKPGAIQNYHCSLKTTTLGKFTMVAKVKANNNLYKATCNVKIVSPTIEVKVRSSSRFIFVNKQVVFTTTIKNSGNGSAYHVATKGILPSELEYISSEPQASYSPPQKKQLARLKWRFTEIAPGEEVEIKVVARGIECTPRTKYSVVATVKNQEFRDSSAVRVEGGCSGMHLSTYDTDDPVEVGQQTIYVVTARNEGTSATTNVKLRNNIPKEMKFIKAEGPGDFTFDKTTGVLESQSMPILQPGDKFTYKIVCEAIKAGSAKNTARVRYDQFKKDIIDEEGTSVYE